MTGDEITAKLEDAEQAILRKQFRDGNTKHFSDAASTFDRIAGEGRMLVRRDDRAAILVIPPDEYGG